MVFFRMLRPAAAAAAAAWGRILLPSTVATSWLVTERSTAGCSLFSATPDRANLRLELASGQRPLRRAIEIFGRSGGVK